MRWALSNLVVVIALILPDLVAAQAKKLKEWD